MARFRRHDAAGLSRRSTPQVSEELTAYCSWHVEEVVLAGRAYALAGKPGLFAFGTPDPARRLLAERVASVGELLLLDLNSGAGLVGTVAALAGASKVVLADRNVIAVEAARRTVSLNQAPNAEVGLSHGTAGLSGIGGAGSVAVRLPKGRPPMMQLLWDAFAALDPGGECLLAGANNEGIKPAGHTLERLFGNAITEAYGGGARLLSARKEAQEPADPSAFREPWLRHDAFHAFAVELRGRSYQLRSRPGVFSWDRLDEGTRVLAENMEIGERDRVLDLGCGCGVLTVVAASLATRGHVHGVDVDVEAVRSARATAAANGIENCTILPSDAGSAVRELTFDTVLTNPPFHVGRQAVLEIARQFIRDASSVLCPGGRLFLVANRTLPYERVVQKEFGNVHLAVETSGFKVIVATAKK